VSKNILHRKINNSEFSKGHPEDYDKLRILLGWGDKKCIQNFDEEFFWKAFTSKNERDERIKLISFRKAVFENRRWMEVSREHVLR
jgi:hypothetical protein